jgi:hypothetical protein
MAQCHQWQAHPPSMLQDPSSFFSRQYNQQHNSGKTWQGQPFANPTWKSQQYPTAPWTNQPAANPTWPNLQYPTPFWQNSNNNSYPSQWTSTTAQAPN